MTERDIFLAVLDLPDPAARAAYLDAACGGDAARRARVDALLQAHESAGSFLAEPAVAAAEPGRDATRTYAATVDAGATTASGDEDLPFLTPPQRPDSLGRIGHYEVLEVLGRGGFGIVFRAFDEVLQRVVAVKVLAPGMAATSPARKRFLREARSSAQVRHENVVQVYAVEEQPLPYLVMEFIPGETLQQRLDRTGPLDVAEVLRVGRQIAEGLAAAHAQGLIHRDIKPANVLIEGGPPHRVKLTDFGLARAADDASISQSGIVAGTPMYMAPEQARGETLDHRADLFSLGSVLYTMLTGHPPFRASGTMAVLKRVCEDDPRPMRETIPEVPDWLCRVVETLHAKDPAGRFQTAREVADLLADAESQWAAHGAVRDFSRIPGGRPAARRSRRRAWAVAALICLALAGVGLGLAAWGPFALHRTVLARNRSSGFVTVRTAEPDLVVTLDDQTFILNHAEVPDPRPSAPPRTDSAKIAVRPGGHHLRAVKDGVVIHDETFTLAAGGVKDVDIPGPRRAVAWGQVVDPLGDCRVTDQNGLLTIAVPGTRTHNLNPAPGYNLNAPRVLRDVEGDFEAHVTVLPYRRPQAPVTTSPSQPYVGAGLVVWQDGENFLRLFRSWMPTSNVFIHPECYVGGAAAGPDVTGSIGDQPTHLRIRRAGDRLQLAAGPDGQTWTDLATVANLPLAARVRVGVAAVNSTDEDFTARFEGFTMTERSPQAAGWVQLFNGKDLTGWKTLPGDPGVWTVEDGALVADKGPTYLFTEKGGHEDFHLRVEAKVDAASDAGVIFRSAPEIRAGKNNTVTYTSGYEAQINLRPGWPVHTGSLCWARGKTAGESVLKTGPLNPHQPGEWFVLEVMARGNHIRVLVNGRPTADYTDPAQTYRRGHIALQKLFGGATAVRFRKIEIQEQPPAAAPAAARSDQELIQGTWTGVAADNQGLPIPEVVWKAVGPAVTFAGDTVTWTTNPTPAAKEVLGGLLKDFRLDGVFHLDPTKSPKTIDLTVLGPNAKTPLGRPAPRALLGIYRLDGDELELCIAVDPDHAEERPGKFESVPGKAISHIKLRRQRPPAGGAAVPALRDLVAAKGRALDMVRLRFEAGHANALDKALAEIELIEARVRLAEAEGDKAAVVPLLQDLVARREDERQFVAALVEVGRAPHGDLDQADARVADAKARLARARSDAPAAKPAGGKD
jgi:uncharacterized protein (TIGR03067 family)